MFAVKSLKSIISCASFTRQLLTKTPVVYIEIPKFGYKVSLVPTLKVMHKRRKRIGPDQPMHRRKLLEWNYEKELYSFKMRLGETWDKNTLRVAFTEKSYVEQQSKEREVLGVSVDDAALELQSNEIIAKQGETFLIDYLDKTLRSLFPSLPAAGLEAIKQYLISVDVLAKLAKDLGTADLILCTDFPPANETLCNTFNALVGGLVQDSGPDQAAQFVRDFLLTILCDKDILDIWTLGFPKETLNGVLEDQKRPAFEPRMIFESGRNTLESVFHVGVYSDKQFLGRGTGESIGEAESMACRDALRKMFQLNLDMDPIMNKLKN